MSPKKFKTLTIAQRVEIIYSLDKNEPQQALGRKFGVSQSVISRIKQNKDSILHDWEKSVNPNRKRKRSGHSQEVEAALLKWFSQVRSRNLPVNGPLLLEKANQLAEKLNVLDFVATSGWLERWKERNNIKFRKLHGERQDADTESAERWIADILPDLIKGTAPRNIFNADETGLYWKAIPDGTLAFKKHDIAGSKMSKERITLLLTTNMDGSEKLEPLIIGRSKNPRCFKNVKTLPVQYKANANAWMTSSLWEDWLQNLDHRMKVQKRKFLLFVDNCAAHKNVLRLNNVSVIFLPPNTTSIMQPMYQGIISNFKRQYRSLILRRLVALIDEGCAGRATELAKKLSILDALHMVQQAWQKINQTTIANCWRKAKFAKEQTENLIEVEDNVSTVYERANMDADDFEFYVCMDNGLPTESDEFHDKEPGDDGDSQCNDDDTPAEDNPPPTLAAALQAVGILRHFMETRNIVSFETLYALENQVLDISNKTGTQRVITDYFSNTEAFVVDST